MRRLQAALLVVLMVGTVAAVSGAKYINMLEPYNYVIYPNSNAVYLGNVGPGETFYVTVSSATPNETGYMFNYGWNKLAVSDLPSGWIGQNSSLNTEDLSAKIAVSPYAKNGTYYFNLTAINTGNYSKLGTLSFKAYVNVTPNVFSLNVTPQVVTAGPGQPADIYVTINNTGVSDSPFIISLRGLPAWTTTSTVIALHHASGRFVYPVYENEPGVYHVLLYVNSTASPLVAKQSNLTLIVKAGLLNDYSAIGQGAPLFPIIYAPAYAVMYLLYLLARQI